MKPHTIHAVRFFKPKAKAAHTLIYSEIHQFLAISREDGTIEIWNFKIPSSPFLQFSIPANGSELDRSIEALAFVPDGRLFSTGLHGFVFQHDFFGPKKSSDLNQQKKWSVTSGAVWCMKFNLTQNKLAMGTEEGYVSLYDVVAEGLNFNKILDKQEGRVLSLDWHIDGKHLVTGSTDTLRLWDTKSGHPLQRMSTGRLEKNLETVVWSVLMLNDFTVVSGDSRGKTSFWNSKNGTLIESYQSHKAHILTVASNEAQDVIYSSGVDPTIVHFQPVLKKTSNGIMGGSKKWIKSISRNANSHDVHAMTVLNNVNRVVSVGIDANLVVDDCKKRVLTTYPPFRWGSNVICAPKAKMVAFKHDNSIEIWKLGCHQQSENDKKVLKIKEEPVKVVELKVKSDETIHNLGLSSDAGFLAYSTGSKLRLFKLDLLSTGVPKIQRLVINHPGSAAAGDNNSTVVVVNLMKFTCKDQLLIADNAGHLSLFSLNSDIENASLIWSVGEDKLQLKGGIDQLEIEPEGDFCVVSDFANNIIVYNITNEKIQSKLPKYEEACITCIAIHPRSKNVIVVYANHHFVECCPKTGKYTKLTSILHENEDKLPRNWINKSRTTKGVLFPQGHLGGLIGKKSDTIMFYDEQLIAVLDRSSVMNDTGSASSSKQTRKSILATSNSTPGRNSPMRNSPMKNSPMKNSPMKATAPIDTKDWMRVTAKRFEHLIYLGTLNPADNSDDLTCPLVAVEVKPQTMESQLPPSIRQKKFGAM